MRRRRARASDPLIKREGLDFAPKERKCGGLVMIIGVPSAVSRDYRDNEGMGIFVNWNIY